MRKWFFLIMVSCMLGLTACSIAKEEEKPEKEIEKVVTKEETAAEENKSDSKVEATVTEEVVVSTDKELVQYYVDDVRVAYMEVTDLAVRWDELRFGSSNGQLDSYTFATTIYEEILPQNMFVLENIEAIIPPNDDIAATHEILIDAISKQHIAFSEIAAGLDANDPNKITKANEILNEVRKLDREFSRKMEALIKEYGIQ
ncbi:hypothetical protein H9650_13375 [Psychrobacillus sp. Sa2BUA9]|uniref:Lipoprotein n=1 Tax=Psychrobacillus faecigallinarum TaxID=2762235 RepID=A0ABR8RBH9_9BACI|nr:hypothetical protein [Psychrobacillus faecigallinarum]MBD7945111.1 hypothetical protein [Psychrobacillus faecigallinarum]